MRVCWLREKDRAERWGEELVLCQTDLACCERYFRHKKTVWAQRMENAEKERKRGHQCYAAKQLAVWGLLESRAHKAIENTAKQLKAEGL